MISWRDQIQTEAVKLRDCEPSMIVNRMLIKTKYVSWNEKKKYCLSSNAQRIIDRKICGK